MDMKNSLALKKKRELLGSVNKRKMSLRKYMDNLKQDECRLDINQITKCVFLGSLCLKPVLHLFDSPLLLEELDMKMEGVRNNITINHENVGEVVQSPVLEREPVTSEFVKKGKRKCLNSPKTKKKSLREKNESKNLSSSLSNIKKENVKLEINESGRTDEMEQNTSPVPIANDINEAVSSVSNTTDNKTQEGDITSNVVEPPTDEIITIEITDGIQTNIEILTEEMLNGNNIESKIIAPKKESVNVPSDIKTNDTASPDYENDVRLKRELTPELLISDSDDDTIDQLMINIMDIKIGPNDFENNFFDLPSATIDKFEYTDNEFDEKVECAEGDNCTAKDKKTSKPPTPQCKICSQVFPSYMKLKTHKMTHAGDKPYLCLKCKENYSTLDQLLAHLRTHQGKHPYVCKKCGKGFKTMKSLNNHRPVHVLRKVVPPKKTYSCEVCRKEFHKLCDLDRHTRVHTGEKPSVCNICNKRFQQAHNLNKHLLIHTQEKPFQCDICNKKFGRNDVLNRHLLTHSVDKPNHCETCMKSFIRVSQLLTHKEKYHPQEAS